jgi:hypothetical protein
MSKECWQFVSRGNVPSRAWILTCCYKKHFHRGKRALDRLPVCFLTIRCDRQPYNRIAVTNTFMMCASFIRRFVQ